VLESLAAKSVTAAIAVELSRLQGGDPSLTAPAVVLTGMLGAMLGPTVLSWARVRQPLARGIALGTISHAQGTAVALQEHEASGAVSTLALAGAALMTTLLLPFALPAALHLLGR
jgi:putative effector of murein hydrolase